MSKNINALKRTTQVLNILLYSKVEVPMAQIALELQVSQRSVYYYLKGIDELLESMELGILGLGKNGYFLTTEQAKQINVLLKEKFSVFSRDNRIHYIICITMYHREIIRIDTLMKQFDVSRNTVIEDLKEVKELLEKYKLILCNTKKRGYYIEGQTFCKRTVLLYYLSILLKEIDYKSMTIFNLKEVEHYYKNIIKIFEKLEIVITHEKQLALAFLISIISLEKDNYNFSVSDLKYIYSSKELKLVDVYFSDLCIQEKIYLVVHLIGYRENRDFLIMNDCVTEHKDIELLNLSRELVNLFENKAFVTFEKKEELIQSIYLHLKLSFYVCSYSVQIVNPLLEEVKENYNDIYMITRYCCDELKNNFHFPVFDSEVAYLSMHFGSFLQRNNQKSHKIFVLIVCPNGKTSSMLLKSEVENYFNNIEVIDILPICDIDKYKGKIDFVISTVDISCKYPSVLVKPILTPKDKSRIKSILMLHQSEYQFESSQSKSMIDIIRSNVNNDIFEKICSELHIKINSNGDHIVNEPQNINLPNILEQYDILIKPQSGIKWDEAITATSESLIIQKCITYNYVNKMISLVYQNGPYIAISPHIAIAHAKPEDGATCLGLSLMIIPEGLEIGQFKIKFLFVLATPNQRDHLHLLQNIVILNDRPEVMDKLVKVNSKQDAIDILRTL